jgi:hypothetical protein
MRRFLTVLGLAALLPAPLFAQRVRADSAFLAQMRWRSIGPANMSGRVSGVVANPQNPKVIYAAFATGGVWKTVNAGTTWEPIFDRTGAHAVSEVALSLSDTNTVWAGTGEEDSRNSISPGNGVYKSTDGGRTWTNMGLRETQHIGRIVIHPTNPNIVWVAALGRAWGPNRERGLYKTTDGGTTWRLVKFISDRAGFVDLAIDPSNPDVLYASAWQRQRTAYSLQSVRVGTVRRGRRTQRSEHRLPPRRGGLECESGVGARGAGARLRARHDEAGLAAVRPVPVDRCRRDLDADEQREQPAVLLFAAGG